jgi:hypothetical protein
MPDVVYLRDGNRLDEKVPFLMLAINLLSFPISSYSEEDLRDMCRLR